MRLGITSDPATGARHFPAGAVVQRTLDGRSGDLYALSCLTPPSEPLFEPYTVRFTRDAQGFRNAPDLPATVDLVVLGDSFTEAESVQQPFWESLAPTVYNLGLPDSGTLEQLALLKAHGLARGPKTVVLAYFGGNDLQNNADFAALRAANQTYESRAWRAPLAQFLVTPRLVAFLAAPRLTCPYPIQDRQSSPLAFYEPFFANAMLPPDALRQTEPWKLTSDALRETATATKAAGVRFIVVYIPFKAQTHVEQLTDAQLADLRARVSPEPFGYELHTAAPFSLEAFDAQRALLAELAAESGFEFLDLTPAFRAAAARGEQRYFYGDTHWNQNGHDMAHDQIAAVLAESL
ncbi:MAG: hypothetical protein IPK19_34835 [Chloroflexi bacterium]|nr:hypothetical protein [Chloroflexota bacterium]